MQYLVPPYSQVPRPMSTEHNPDCRVPVVYLASSDHQVKIYE